MVQASGAGLVALWAALVGCVTEPAGAAAYAGLKKVAQGLAPNSVVVVLTTGNGLKDTGSAALGLEVPEHCIDTIDDIN